MILSIARKAILAAAKEALRATVGIGILVIAFHAYEALEQRK